jgi:hypothetical protein
MNRFLPVLFSFLVSGTIAAAVISILVCGALDGISRLISFRTQRPTEPVRQRNVA